jgi:signal transduction histidine kinase/CheY-like chemotaxis protein
MLVEFLLDIKKVANKSLDFISWFSRGLLVIALIVPNLVLYLVALNIHSDPLSIFGLLESTLLLTKQIFFVTGLLMSMFSHKMESVNNSLNKLQISVSNWTVGALTLWLFNRSFLTAASFVLDNTEAASVLNIIRITFAFLTLCTVLFIIFSVLYFLSKQQVGFGQFLSHEHFSDYYNMWVLLSFIVAEIILNATYLNSSNANGKFSQSRTENRGYFIGSLFVQVALTIMLTVIPGQSYQLLAEIERQKLNTRLNLIRYVSHEMRTPLNTAFLGLEMLSTELQSISNKYERMSAVSESRDYQNHYGKRDISEETKYLDSASSSFCEKPTAQPNNFMNEAVEEMEDTVKKVQDSCKVAVETLDDLLTFDKLDERKLVIEVTELNPWEFLCEAARPFEISAKMLGINFEIMLCEENGNANWCQRYCIKGDKFKLAQVVRNLCSNSLKFTSSQGTVTVLLKLLQESESKLILSPGSRAISITITDTGAGISAENQSKLFGPYVQFNPGKLQQGKGSGLGLWISKSIVEMHCGIIWAFSDGEGKGSVFGVELPAFPRQPDASNVEDECSHSIVPVGFENGHALETKDEENQLSHDAVHQIVDKMKSIQAVEFPQMNRYLLDNEVVLKDVTPSPRPIIASPSMPHAPLTSSERSLHNQAVAQANVPPQTQQGSNTPCTQEVKSRRHKSWETGLHFLIVDDTHSSRKMLRKLLMIAGHRVSEAVDGIDCLEQLDYLRDDNELPMGAKSELAQQVDIILIDEHMPRMEGHTCCQILQAKHFPIPIIAVTGSVQEEKLSGLLHFGVSAVLPKPLTMSTLKQAVYNIFKSKSEDNHTELEHK